ncbi:MAG: polyprenyl synthetase family protein [Ruminiclostridium sp.]|nr:polyprenyl synthetase family protein [Ruminiclostridium sp.]
MNGLEKYINMVNEKLFSFLPEEELRQKRVVEAARYSLSAGGKRIRPVLALRFCEMCGGTAEKVLATACAVEYIHTFSLIHDDLPCMDDDDFRRGKPSCHKAFDEYTALLAGDALTVKPFEIISESALNGEISPLASAKIISFLAKSVGFCGMIGGQQIDTENNGHIENPDDILDMYAMKTSDLLKAACCCGVLCAESEKEAEYMKAAENYAYNLGLAFQIIDDILDITSTSEALGKPVGSDEKSGKHTFASVVGLEKARQKAEELTQSALSALEVFPDNGFVRELTNMLLERNN